ncbi:MAG TPA: EF-hand domain-containing protein [Hyphomicrobium sp.]|nr:EF-hand domain-containing protein [Hyphomicrobium sp.]HRO49341.1 EF-hand domain-containing protein [Hyphomicrobium sp.]
MTTRIAVLPFALVLAGAIGIGAAHVSGLPAHAGEPGATASEALSLDDCRAVWNLAAGRSDLGRDQATPYVPDFAAVDTNGDGKITNAEFRVGCEKGLVQKARRAD